MGKSVRDLDKGCCCLSLETASYIVALLFLLDQLGQLRSLSLSSSIIYQYMLFIIHSVLIIVCIITIFGVHKRETSYLKAFICGVIFFIPVFVIQYILLFSHVPSLCHLVHNALAYKTVSTAHNWPKIRFVENFFSKRPHSCVCIAVTSLSIQFISGTLCYLYYAWIVKSLVHKIENGKAYDLVPNNEIEE